MATNGRLRDYLTRDEVRALRDREAGSADYLFRSERGDKLTRYAFWRIVSEAGKRAELPMKVYAHQLRHACGYALVNRGCDLRLIQEYLGHREIQNTVRYTVLNARRFEGLW